MTPKAVFLDRDGVLVDNSQHYYIWEMAQLTVVEGVLDNLRLLNESGYLLFVVSNQGGVARGLYTRQDVVGFHVKLQQLFSENQVEIAEFQFCPHHPEIEKCLCRKPSALMLEKLIAKHSLKKTNCWMIGDSKSDIEAANQAGIHSILVEANRNIRDQIRLLLNE